MATLAELKSEFGDIDIYLFDQLLRQRITSGMRVLDAGCGGGRNLVYLMRCGLDLWGVDEDASAIASARTQASALSPALGRDRFSVHAVEKLPFDASSFDVVLSSAVLHFARDQAHWWAMLAEMWRVLRTGGLLWSRLASTIGQESRVRPLGGRRYRVPDGSERFLVDEPFLAAATEKLGGQLADPIKTTVVQSTRSMTTWVLRKP
ncbi:MAG: class I SAM-dependent methyltransferase [Gemmatimonadetes bacterium]|nr:class I SAM-dependent methyltransferase [Gemmatimonadota bacterium]